MLASPPFARRWKTVFIFPFVMLSIIVSVTGTFPFGPSASPVAVNSKPLYCLLACSDFPWFVFGAAVVNAAKDDSAILATRSTVSVITILVFIFIIHKLFGFLLF